jgi:hypothetical protein
MTVALLIQMIEKALLTEVKLENDRRETLDRITTRNRTNLLQYWGFRHGEDRKNQQIELSSNQKLNYEIIYKNYASDVKERRIKSIELTIIPGRKNSDTIGAVTLKPSISRKHTDTYPLFFKNTDLSVTKQYLLYSLLSSNKNFSVILTDPEAKLPTTLSADKEMSERFFYSFFQSPYDNIEHVIAEYKKYSNLEKDRKSIYIEAFETVNFRDLLLGELLLQESFCRIVLDKIIDESHGHESLNENPIVNVSRLMDHGGEIGFETKAKLFIKVNKLQLLLSQKVDDITSHKYNTTAVIHYYDNFEAFKKISTLFQDVLFLLIKLAFSANEKETIKEWSKQELQIRRFSAIAEEDLSYRPLLQTICAASIIQQKINPLPLTLFEKIYAYFLEEVGFPYDAVNQVLHNSYSSDLMLLNTMIKSCFTINLDQQSILLKQDLTISWHEAVLKNNCDISCVYLPDELKTNSKDLMALFSQHCLSLFWEDVLDNKALVDLMEHHLGSFTEGRLSSVFTYNKQRNCYVVSTDFRPLVHGGYESAKVPRWAGLFYSFQPSIDFSPYKHLKFNIRSSDGSIGFIQIEFKNVDTPQKEHKVPLNISDDWVECSINLDQVPHPILNKTEQICFVISPSSFLKDSLIGSFDLESVRVE